MGRMEVDCVNLKAAENLAREKGLINGESLSCPDMSTCTGEVCTYSEEPQNRTLWLENSGSNPVDPMEKFNDRLRKTAEMNNVVVFEDTGTDSDQAIVG